MNRRTHRTHADRVDGAHAEGVRGAVHQTSHHHCRDHRVGVRHHHGEVRTVGRLLDPVTHDRIAAVVRRCGEGQNDRGVTRRRSERRGGAGQTGRDDRGRNGRRADAAGVDGAHAEQIGGAIAQTGNDTTGGDRRRVGDDRAPRRTIVGGLLHAVARHDGSPVVGRSVPREGCSTVRWRGGDVDRSAWGTTRGDTDARRRRTDTGGVRPRHTERVRRAVRQARHRVTGERVAGGGHRRPGGAVGGRLDRVTDHRGAVVTGGRP